MKTVGVATDAGNELTWVAATDDVGVVLHRIYRDRAGDGVFVEVGTSPDTTFVDTDVDTGVTYRYHLRAEDAAGNLGWRTGDRSVTAR